MFALPCVCTQLLSGPDSATSWTVAHQASLSMGFSRQEYWSGSPFPSLGGLPNPGIEPLSLRFPTLAGGDSLLLVLPVWLPANDM